MQRHRESKAAIREYVESTFGYDLGSKLEDLRHGYTFDSSCQGSVPIAIMAFLQRDNALDALRLAVSMGGDSDPIGCINWFGVDDANTALFVPMYCSITEAPEAYRQGKADLYTFDFDAAFWVNNLIANQCYNRYSQMIPDVRRVQKALEDKFAADVALVDRKAQAIYKTNPAEAVEFLTNFSANTAQEATRQYQDLAKYLFVKFLDGNIKKEKDGHFERNKAGVPVQPTFGGYTQDYYNTVVRGSGDRLKVIEPEK